MTDTVDPKVILTVKNRHYKNRGEPPSIKGDGPGYIGYHEILHGEQSIFTFDAASRTGTIVAGHVGREKWYAIRVLCRLRTQIYYVLSQTGGYWADYGRYAAQPYSMTPTRAA